MGKLISFIIIVVLLLLLFWSIFKKNKEKKPDFKSEIKKLKLKLYQEIANAQAGIEGSEQMIIKYRRELLELEELNNKINQK